MKKFGQSSNDCGKVLLHVFEVEEQNILRMLLRPLPPALYVIDPCAPPHQVGRCVPLFEFRNRWRHRTDVGYYEVNTTGKARNGMTGHINVSRCGVVGT